jgi:hypothetical protein
MSLDAMGRTARRRALRTRERNRAMIAMLGGNEKII